MAKRSAGAAFQEAARTIILERRAFHPTGAAGSGLHAYDGLLPDYSAPRLARRLARIERQLKALDSFEGRARLSPSQRLELGVLKGMLLSERWDFVDEETTKQLPSTFLFRMSVLNYLMRNYAPLDRRLRAIAKLQTQVPRFLRQLRDSIERRLAETKYEMAEMAARGIADQYDREVTQALAAASPAVQKLVQRTNAAAVNEVNLFVSELEAKYKPRVKKEFALGRRKFERMIFSEHLSAISIDRLLEVGAADLEQNKRAFLETASKIDARLKPHEVVEGIESDHPTQDSLIEDTRAMLEDLRRFVVEHDVVSVPSEARAEVIETPRFYRFATAAMNSPGAFEKVAKEAYYYVTPVEDSWPPEKREEWLRHLNYTSLRNISVHECYPGHYVHFLHRKNVKSTVLRSYYSYAFTEGWAHYCEEMMVDQGLGGGDPRLRLAMLQDALLRNCRYLSSIRMHTDGWSWEDATRFFMENAFLDRLPAEREAKRGTWDPGYLNYTLGKLMIKKLRRDFLAMNQRATLREFHDQFLGMGAPPLGLAREHLLGPNAGPAL